MEVKEYTADVLKQACARAAEKLNLSGVHTLPVSEYNELIIKHDEAHERAEHFETLARQYRKKVLELIDDSTITDLRLSLQGLVSPQDGPRPGFEYLDVDTNTSLVNSINAMGGANQHQQRHRDAKLGRVSAGLDRGKTNRLLPIKERE